jgi:hypothetical protein
VAMPRMSRHGLRWRIRRGRIASRSRTEHMGRRRWEDINALRLRCHWSHCGRRNRLRRVLGYCDRQRSDKVQGTSIEAASNLTR